MSKVNFFVLCNSSTCVRWEVADDMHRDPHSPSFQELLGSMETSSEHWDETLPQEKFLKAQVLVPVQVRAEQIH